MSSSRAVSGPSLAAIPANARKTVQSLKEIVTNNDLVDDEIYALLKECNMDPDETVQRLLKQDPFHEVKRRRDKKKEWNREGADAKLRAAAGSGHSRGGRASGRGGSLSRHGSSDFNGGGRGKAAVARENGNVNIASRASSTATGSSPSTATQGPGRSHPLTPSQSAPVTTSSSGLQNGSSPYTRPATATHGSWVGSGPGHATMADVVKANGTSLPAKGLSSALVTMSLGTSAATPASHQYMMSGTTPPVTSGVYSSATDPVLHPSLDTRASGAQGAIKRDIGTVGNQRSKADWSAASVPIDAISASPLTSQALHTSQTSTSSPVAVPNLERESQVTRPVTPPPPVSPPGLQDRVASVAEAGGQSRQGAGPSSNATQGSRIAVGGATFGARSVYTSQQHPVGTQKGLEWKPKSVAQNSVSRGAVNTSSTTENLRPPSPAASGNSGMLSSTTSKMQGVTIQDDQPVIIPNHLQVNDAEQTHLSFGSFGAGFGKSFSSSYVSEESEERTVPAVESPSVIETSLDPSSASSVPSTPPVAQSQSFVHQSITAPEEGLSSSEAPAVSLPPSALPSDLPKPDPVTQQGPHFPYLPPIQNYASFNMVQQVPVPQFSYEASDSQPPDVSRIPSLVPYADHTASYYTPIFRPGPDGDVRYPPFVTSNTSTKYNGNVGLVSLTGQNLSSQESGTAVLPTVQPTQTSQAGNGVTAVPTVPQQPVPLHAYAGQPGGAPLGHPFANMFGYPYLPSYAYMHTHGPPYQHNYTTNTVYPQAPAGSSYPAATAATYPPGGGTAVKYQLSQYKPASATTITPHSAAPAGYSGYSSAPSGYAANSSVSVGSTGYDDVTVQQYKDNIYIPTQQVEGSTVWIQAPPSRDMSVGSMQPSSYYNLPGQAQHGNYAHTQQPAHAHGSHPGYANVYHPSQSGQNPSTHQLLQQPQSMNAGSSQAGGYQQSQRSQQTWNNY